MDKIRFRSYGDWRSKITDGTVDIYFKTYLKELGLKPAKNVTPCKLVDVYIAGRWKRDIEAFTLDQAVEIKKRNKNHSIISLDMTIENICKSLYIINKSAKKSRDTKGENYYKGNFQVVSASKTRQNNLYSLKNDTMKKLIKNNLLKLEGYHKQFDSNLLYYTYNDFGFHIPVDYNTDVTEFEFLGEIENLISAEQVIKTNDVKFSQAKELLERFNSDDTVIF